MRAGRLGRVGLVWLVLFWGYDRTGEAVTTPSVVISQVYGAGGNSGALYRHDFIELFNRGSATVDLTGWAIHYASATGTSWQRTLLGGTLQPGQRYLIQQASGGGSGIALPTPDSVGTIAMAATAGKLLLTSTDTVPGPSAGCPAGLTVIDLVGYGSAASCFEGSARGPAPGSTTALVRREGGCTDSDQNGSDFLLQAPLPRNSSTPLTPCNAPTLPQVTAQAIPDPVLAGSVVLLVATVTPGERPMSTGMEVTADLGALGGSATFSLLDDGQQGDASAGDGQYSRAVLLPFDLPPGPRSLPVRVVDDQGRVGEGLLPLTVAPPLPASPVVISQIFAGGGNSGAPYTHDWVELFHRGEAPVDLAGWSLQYAPATSGTWTATPLAGRIEPGQFYLIRLASSGTAGIAPPPPDATGTTNLSSTGGKIALSNQTAPLTGTCPVGGGRVDFVGYGSTANCFEGERAAPAPQAASVLLRREGGCADSDQNGADFLLQAPLPRNRSAPLAPCNAPTLPQVTAQAVPDPVLAGSVVLLVATVTPGERPMSTGIQVTADLRLLGGSATFSLLDDGQQGDASAGDGQYSRAVLLPFDLAPGPRSLPVRVVDDQGRVGEGLLPLTLAPPLPASPVVISQIFAGGGNSGAPYTHDWVELFHRGEAPVDLTGWSLQYASAASGTWTATMLAGRIEPGQFYLIRLASSGTAGIAPPPPDATGTTNLSSTGGKIALSNQTAPLTGTCPVGGGRVDFVGYGLTANCFEGERAAPAPQTSAALLRRQFGCIDRDQNGEDWGVGAARPRNRTSPTENCQENEAIARRSVSAQHPGSILLFPLYSSRSASPVQENTRLTITNTHPRDPVRLHLFWMDGGSASMADHQTCLTPNQTVSLLASDLDPDISGFLLVITVDPISGCPTRFNSLIGEALVKLESGHLANLAALSIAALDREPAACPLTASTVTLSFDGLLYQPLPTTLAAAHLPSPGDGLQPLLVLVRIGGNLGTGGSTIGAVSGWVYDDLEQPARFGLSIGRRQLRSLLNDSFPRTTPRLSALLPPSRSGWMRIAQRDGGALIGALLVGSSGDGRGMVGGRLLHTLSLTTSVELVMPLVTSGGLACGGGG